MTPKISFAEKMSIFGSKTVGNGINTWGKRQICSQNENICCQNGRIISLF